MFNKHYIENEISKLQKEANRLGFKIKELLVLDPKIIPELEKKDMSRHIKNLTRKPNFISPANYRLVKLNEDEYGILFNIVLKKEATPCKKMFKPKYPKKKRLPLWMSKFWKRKP
jgi:hypothetical protein